MMEYLEHTGSGLFAVPPGINKEGHWGDTLFS
jgi:deferrochelatase/peroxidase EfeB